MASFAVPLVGIIAENYFGYHIGEDQIHGSRCAREHTKGTVRGREEVLARES